MPEISKLPPIKDTDVASNDVMMLVDVSAQKTGSRKIQAGELARALNALVTFEPLKCFEAPGDQGYVIETGFELTVLPNYALFRVRIFNAQNAVYTFKVDQTDAKSIKISDGITLNRDPLPGEILDDTTLLLQWEEFQDCYKLLNPSLPKINILSKYEATDNGIGYGVATGLSIQQLYKDVVLRVKLVNVPNVPFKMSVDSVSQKDMKVIDAFGLRDMTGNDVPNNDIVLLQWDEINDYWILLNQEPQTSKEYIIGVNQIGISDPVVAEIKNTLNEMPILSRVGVGTYKMTMPSGFPAGETFVRVVENFQWNTPLNPNIILRHTINGSNEIIFSLYDGINNLVEISSLPYYAPYALKIEIEVYP